MALRPKSEQLRKFIIKNVEGHPTDIPKLTAEAFGITRQAVHRHLDILIEDDILEAKGGTRSRTYNLKATRNGHVLDLRVHRDEDKVYRDYIEPQLEGLQENVLKICHYGFTEMFNNAIDHSGGQQARVSVLRTAKSTTLTITDDGIGIFEKVKAATGLSDHLYVILELSKGKLTTDPDRHTGQGIFFTSRMCDRFTVSANNFLFGHLEDFEDWFIEDHPGADVGTRIGLTIENDASRTSREVFERFSEPESGDYEFSRTHVPLKLAKYGGDGLVSRSAAKRVLARFDRFKEIILDFSGVDSIGHSFADEVFRVFPLHNPGIALVVIGANDMVTGEINRAKQGGRSRERPGGV